MELLDTLILQVYSLPWPMYIVAIVAYVCLITALGLLVGKGLRRLSDAWQDEPRKWR